MASLAIPPERVLVRRVAKVAASTASRELDVAPEAGRGRRRIDGAVMTSLALQVLVPSRERVVGLLGVVEPPSLPAVGIVTERAGRAQGSLVGVRKAVTLDTCGARLLEATARVTVFAGRELVEREEREGRQIVVEANDLAPARLFMTLAAVVTRPTLVNVDGLVARDAAGGRLLEVQGLHVAEIASKLAVGVSQGELRIPRVIEVQRLPAAGFVTLLAGVAPPAVVVVVDLVATLAVHRELHGLRLRFVTIAARKSRVSPFEPEAGLPCVIEAGLLPLAGVVTGLALRPQAPPVDVVHLVARDAGHRRLPEALLGMAERAGRVRVPPLERKPRLAVVELGLPPTPRLVTVLALLAEMAPVRIFLCMTCSAGVRCVAMQLAGLVAPCTGGRSVGPLERKVRLLVVEGFRNEPDDVGIGSLVLQVTGSTGDGARLPEPAVKPLPLPEILPDGLVTLDAAIVLRSLIEALVAILALSRLFLMSGAERAGGDQALEVHGSRRL